MLMQPVVAPSRSNHTRSVLARFLVRFSGNGIFTDVTRLMALRTSSRSAALMEVGATARSKHARRRGLIGWNIWENLRKSRSTQRRPGIVFPLARGRVQVELPTAAEVRHGEKMSDAPRGEPLPPADEAPAQRMDGL